MLRKILAVFLSAFIFLASSTNVIFAIEISSPSLEGETVISPQGETPESNEQCQEMKYFYPPEDACWTFHEEENDQRAHTATTHATIVYASSEIRTRYEPYIIAAQAIWGNLIELSTPEGSALMEDYESSEYNGLICENKTPAAHKDVPTSEIATTCIQRIGNDKMNHIVEWEIIIDETEFQSLPNITPDDENDANRIRALIIAHEIGHAFGLDHVGDGNSYVATDPYNYHLMKRGYIPGKAIQPIERIAMEVVTHQHEHTLFETNSSGSTHKKECTTCKGYYLYTTSVAISANSCLCSCGVPNADESVHTFNSQQKEYDASWHWRTCSSCQNQVGTQHTLSVEYVSSDYHKMVCTDTNCAYESAVTDHTPGNDGNCTQCEEAEQHTHSFAPATCTTPATCECGATTGTATGHSASATHSSNTTHHWKSCTNTGCQERLEYAPHDTSTGNCICVPANHTHQWGSWTFDDTDHYKACTTPGCTAKSQQGSHNFQYTTCTSSEACTCGATNGVIPEHNYIPTKISDTQHQEVCEVCQHIGATSNHTFNAQRDCIICEGHVHAYSAATCTTLATCVCNATTGTLAAHTYGSDCDTTCNVCQATRTVTHVYDSDCDTGCNVCGTIRTVAPHVFTDNCDAICNVSGCNHARVPSHYYSDATCSSPKTCQRCGLTSGSSLGHSWVFNGCLSEEYCYRCGVDGSIPGHDYYNGYCENCGASDPNYVCTHPSESYRDFYYYTTTNPCGGVGYFCTSCGEMTSVSYEWDHLPNYANICLECGMTVDPWLRSLHVCDEDRVFTLSAEAQALIAQLQALYHTDATTIHQYIDTFISNEFAGAVLEYSLTLGTNEQGTEKVDVYRIGQTAEGDDILMVEWYHLNGNEKEMIERYYLYPNGYYRPDADGILKTSQLPIRPSISNAQAALMAQINASKLNTAYPIVNLTTSQEMFRDMYAVGNSISAQNGTVLTDDLTLKIFGRLPENTQIKAVGTVNNEIVYDIRVFNEDGDCVLSYFLCGEYTLITDREEEYTAAPPIIPASIRQPE